jgi:hypothetical protein
MPHVFSLSRQCRLGLRVARFGFLRVGGMRFGFSGARAWFLWVGGLSLSSVDLSVASFPLPIESTASPRVGFR